MIGADPGVEVLTGDQDVDAPPAASMHELDGEGSLTAGSNLILHITGESERYVYQAGSGGPAKADLLTHAVLRPGSDWLDVYWAA